MKQEERLLMKFMASKSIEFKTFSNIRYGTDVAFQMVGRPPRNIPENKIYFSGEHHIYGYKTEVPILPNEIAVNSTN